MRNRTRKEWAAIHSKKGDTTPRTTPLQPKPCRVGGYTLHATKGRNGQTLYFFTKKQGPGVPVPLPRGRRVVQTGTGLPVLRRE